MSAHHPLRVTLAAALGVGVLAVGGCQVTEVISHINTSSVTDLGSEVWPQLSGSPSPERLGEVAHLSISHYLATTDAITREGGEGPERMRPHTTAQWFAVEDESFRQYRALGLRTVGDTVFDSVTVQSLWWPTAGGIEMDAVACIDARGVWLLPTGAPDPPPGLIDWMTSPSDFYELDPEESEEWQEYLDTYQPQLGAREPVVFYLVGDSPDSLAIDGTLDWEGANWCQISPAV